MKNINYIQKFYRICIIDEQEEELVKKVLQTKIETNQEINIFCSFTFITPNYRAISIIKNLCTLSSIYDKIKIHLILSDNNIMTQNYLNDLGLIRTNFNFEKFIESKIIELKNLFFRFGTKQSQIKVYRFSDIWQRLIKDKLLFLEYYTAVSKVKLEKINIEQNDTIGRVFQFSLDAYLSTILHLLFPEEIELPIDFFYGRFEKKELYKLTRDSLYEEGIIKIKKPLFIFVHKHPNIIFKSRMPEWNMNEEEIKYIFDNIRLSKEECIDLINFYRNNLEEVNTKEKSLEKRFDFDGVVKKIKESNEAEFKNIAADVTYLFLKKMKNQQKITDNVLEPNLYIKDKEVLIKISQLLKTKHIIEILKLADGTNKLSEIAKKLDIPISNLSKYVKELKNLRLVYVNQDKCIELNYKNLKIDLENIV